MWISFFAPVTSAAVRDFHGACTEFARSEVGILRV